VYNYDRRGRGDSGDTLPYAVEREIEDLDALVAVAGGSAHLYGVSSGGALVLEAAAGTAADRLAVYEVPYDMADGARQRHREYVERLEGFLAEGRRGDAAALFMRLAGASEEMVADAKASPMWPGLEAIAPTLAYDAACMGDNQPPARFAKITQPTLVATGGGSPDSFVAGGGDFFAKAADAIAAIVPHAERQTLAGQTHMVDPKALAPVLERFFTG
jgi:pimeloyl-ACP methyl ester carboxylesterase